MASTSCYQPHFEDCGLACGPDASCPPDFVCDNGYCARRAGACRGIAVGLPADAADADAADAADDGRAKTCPIGQYFNVVRQTCLHAHDLNGDGKADAVAVNPGEIDALISDGTQFHYAQWFIGGFYGPRGALFDDVTGDGFADGVAFAADYTAIIRSTGDGLSGYRQWPYALVGTWGNCLANVDGDPQEMADLITVHDNDITVAVSTTSDLGSPTVWFTGDFSSYRGVYFADADGDQKNDLIALTPDDVYVARSTGSSFGELEAWHTEPFEGSQATFFADVNGDGLDDGIRIDDATTSVALSDGSSFAAPAIWHIGPLAGERNTFVADVDGDGRGDVVGINVSSVVVSLSTGNDFAPPATWYGGQFQSDRNTTFAPGAVAGQR